MKEIILILAPLVFLFGCVAQSNTNKSSYERPPKTVKTIENCAYSDYQGTEIVFNRLPEILQKYGYNEFSFDYLDSTSNHPEYLKYLGKKAKVKQNILSGWSTTTWREVLVENCDLLYLPATYGYKSLNVEEMQKYADYTLSSIVEQNNKKMQEIQSKIGSPIWIGNEGYKYIVAQEDQKIDIYNYEKVDIVAVISSNTIIELKNLNAAAFYILVKRNTGETGYYPYLESNLSFSNPFPKAWGKTIIEAINKRSVRIGMSKEQAIMAWGKPDKVNKTISEKNINEQWVYSSGGYLYFDNGLLRTVQN